MGTLLGMSMSTLGSRVVKVFQNLELSILCGKPIEIYSEVRDSKTLIGKIHQPKVRDIVELGEYEYNKYISLLLYDTDLIESDVPINLLQFLITQAMYVEDIGKIILKGLSFFFQEEVRFYTENQMGLFYLGELMDERFIDFENYELIRRTLIKINYLKDMEEEEDIKFGNETAREWYIAMKKAEQEKPQPKPKVNLHSIISALMWRSNKTIDEILGMTIYQIYDGYYRLFLIDDSLSMRQGIYSGTVDQKGVKPDDLNWAKIIEFDKN